MYIVPASDILIQD